MRLPERLAANVAWLFTEDPWPDRFAAARRAGFAAVEFPWPDDPAATADAVRASGLAVANLNAPAGDLAEGERGWPNDPSRVGEWRLGFGRALDLAVELACPSVNVLAGNRVAGAADEVQVGCLEDNLRWALDQARKVGVTVATELLNVRENPDYLLVSLDDAAPLLDRLSMPGWKLQLDLWHVALTEVDVPTAIRRAGAHIGHVQVADVPGRHEPGTGDLDWAAIRGALDEVGYRGRFALEYVPRGGLGWITDHPLSR